MPITAQEIADEMSESEVEEFVKQWEIADLKRKKRLECFAFWFSMLISIVVSVVTSVTIIYLLSSK